MSDGRRYSVAMTTATTTPDTEARGILRTAVGAMNDLIVWLIDHPDTFPEATRKRMIEADRLLNSAADDVADLAGAFPAPTLDPDL